MSSTEHYSMSKMLQQSQQVMSQLVLLTGKESLTAGKIADEQTLIATKSNTSTEDVVNKAKHLMWVSGVVNIVSGVAAALSSTLGVTGSASAIASTLQNAIEMGGKVLVYTALPVIKGSFECVESKAQYDLGDAQLTQSEYGSAGRVMSGQSQAVIDAESEVSQKAAAISRDLSQIVGDEKKASTR